MSAAALLVACFTVENNDHSDDLTLMTTASDKAVPSITVDISELEYQQHGGFWMRDSVPFSGHAERNFPNGTSYEKFNVLDGKMEGTHFQWYANGNLMLTAGYSDGKLHGEKRLWSADTAHILLADLNYDNGKGQGVQRRWYPTGELFTITDLNMGREEGLQRAYRKNGDLYANYEAKEGRIFGMKKAALCFGVEGNEVNYEGD